MSGRNENAKIKGRILQDRELAYHFESEDGIRCWLPKSEVQWDDTDEEMEMPEWLAIEKELV